mgnify:CR=1 FL=1
MRTAITRAVEEIKNQYRISGDTIRADESLRGVVIELPATKKFIHIPAYTSKAKIKTLIRKSLKDEKCFQEIMESARLTARQKLLL